MLNNEMIGAHFHQLDFNTHTAAHMVRAVQEGIAFSFRYGLDIMRENGINPTVVRASKANLFLSDVFTKAFAEVNNIALEFYDGDGSFGAAIGAGIGAEIYRSAETALQKREPITTVYPDRPDEYNELYLLWKTRLNEQLDRINQTKALSFSYLN
jgi:xylulokinase